MSAKAEIRGKMRLLLQQQSAELHARRSALLCANLLLDPAWMGAGTVGVFAPHQGEPDVEMLWSRVGGRRLCYPVVRGEELVFRAVQDPADLEASRWGLREPGAHLPEVALGDLDLLLVPGMAFTRAGERLGRGGGFYDRLLARAELRARRIGVCFEFQRVEALPMEEHDQGVERVVTDRD
jgi:5-formyltetrahydrofolate cyclo-ligase